MKKAIAAAVLCAALSSAFAGGADEIEPAPAYPIPDGYELVWADEFDTDGAPNPEKWTYSLGANGWGNGELQNYTDSRANSYIKNGRLYITALNDGGDWTSARLKTQFIVGWTHGFFEIRAKLPAGVGTWPAIWMMPVRDTYGGWPRSGEIDIMEHVGFDENIIHNSIHTRDFNHKNGTQKTMATEIQKVTKEFHTYALEWTPEEIRWYIDGAVSYTYENPGTGTGGWPFDIPYYLILNVAIGGGWGGQEGVDNKIKQASMEVDYVRVYQKAEN